MCGFARFLALFLESAEAPLFVQINVFAIWALRLDRKYTKLIPEQNQKPGDHPNFRKNALGVKRPFSELSESSRVFSEQLSEFEIPFSEYEIPFSEWHLTTWAIRKPQFSEQLPERYPGIGGNPHERSSFAPSFSERFFENWGGPRAEDKKYLL